MTGAIELPKRLPRYAVVIACLCVAVFLAHTYWRYAVAIGWHYRHGNIAHIAGKEVTLPLFWWMEKDPDHWDTTDLFRARPSNYKIVPQITISPSLKGSVGSTDQRVAQTARRTVAFINEHSHTGPSASFVALKAKSLNLYCIRSDFPAGGLVVEQSVLCLTAGVHYSLDYFGPPATTQEAESILSTMQ